MFPGLTPRHDPPRLAVVVAHPDDETFGCGSVLLAAAAAGWRTTVVCATRGELGEAVQGVDLSGHSLGELRERELRASADLLGVADLQLLGFHDSGMEGDATPGSLVDTPYAEVVDAVRRAVGEVDPDVVLTLDASDGHRDHARVRDATIDAVGGDGVRVYLQCLARSLMTRWAEHMATVQPDLAYLRGAELGMPDDEITVTLDSSEHLTTRELAIAQHRSQTSPYEGLPDDLRRAFLTRDHLRLVDGSWVPR